MTSPILILLNDKPADSDQQTQRLASEDPYGDPANQVADAGQFDNVRPASEDPYGDPAQACCPLLECRLLGTGGSRQSCNRASPRLQPSSPKSVEIYSQPWACLELLLTTPKLEGLTLLSGKTCLPFWLFCNLSEVKQDATGSWLDQGVACFNLVDFEIEKLQRQPSRAKQDTQTCTLENVNQPGAPLP